MEYTIDGTTMQTVTIELNAGESVYTEAGGMAWMSDNIEMETGMKGGLMKALGRALGGESMFLTTFTAQGGHASLTMANEFPGKVLPLQLRPGESMICQRDAFMAAEESVQLEMHFRKRLGAGLFGGEGFILQKITGPGLAFVEMAGEITERHLEAGERLKVDTGHVAMFEPTVDFDIIMLKGVKNMLFGGEGLFLAVLQGPGRVWLQSMPIANLAAKLGALMPSKG